jgi:hypothetical protein
LTYDDFDEFPLQSSAISLKRVEDPTNFEAYFGSAAMSAFRGIRSLDVSALVVKGHVTFVNQAMLVVLSHRGSAALSAFRGIRSLDVGAPKIKF